MRELKLLRVASRVAASTIREVWLESTAPKDWMPDIPDEADRREFLRDDLEPPKRRKTSLTQPLRERRDYGGG